MSFVMVDSDKSAAQAESHRLCSLKSHHQGAWQSGTSSCRYRFEPCPVERPPLDVPAEDAHADACHLAWDDKLREGEKRSLLRLGDAA